MCKSFVHLHNHTEYSLLDGAQRIPEMVSRAKQLGMPALAISDHGAMFGTQEFYRECKAQGVKPIIGMEAYVAPDGMNVKSGREENQTYHLLLLAKNKKGYHNLCKLATASALQGFYYKPRIDHEILREYSEGLISTTTCLGSEVNQYLLQGNYEKAKNTAAMYRDIFGKENFFVELQDHNLEEQRRIKPGLLQIASELGLELVATNDSHYLCKGDAEAHDVLLCIQTGRKVGDSDRMKFETEEFYLKTESEMSELFADTPSAIENTVAISDMVDLDLESDRAELPDPKIPDGFEPNSYLRHLSEAGLSKMNDTSEFAKERLAYELKVIEQTGFAKYFLLVREFADFSRNSGIYFGVRGSAAGSLVSHCIGITDVDPLKYNLTFERFLNPERIQMPDIDMDFEDARRQEVIDYVKQRFGDDHVAQIITFGTLGAKAAIRDAGRALGMPLPDVDRLAKLIPTIPVGWTIEKALNEVAEFRSAYKSSNDLKKLIDTAKKIEGVSRNAGVHAAGIVISKEALSERVPLTKSQDNQIVTQFPMGDLEKIGLLKMDFLGLSNLTVLAKAVENIKKTKGILIDVQNIPLNDSKTYEMLGRGETTGVFQLESDGMRRAITAMKPDSVLDLTALVALYRPGPMDHIQSYINGKHGKRKPEYLHELMKPILEETYGVIVYQDQVLQLVRNLAGFSLGKADILRRAMGKKDKFLLDSMKIEFIEGTKNNGIPTDIAEAVWVLLEPFAGYAFNKAHAVCYAMIAYQTAYLKSNFPVEYMAALLGVYREKEDRVVMFIEEARKMGLKVLPPDINLSSVDFTIENPHGDAKIRFGLGAIKGIGDAAIQSILNSRESGAYSHLYEFAVRVRELGGLNRTGIESLIRAGCFDSIEPNRRKLLEVVDTAVATAEKMNRDKESGQADLFGNTNNKKHDSWPSLPDVIPPTRQEILTMEKEVLGLYVSDHPLRGFERQIQELSTSSASNLEELSDGDEIKIAGIIASVREIRTRKTNELMATVTLEDLTGQSTVTLFSRGYQEFKHLLSKDEIVVVTGNIRHREQIGTNRRLIEILARKIERLDREEISKTSIQPLDANGVVIFRIVQASYSELKTAHELITSNPGTYRFRIEIVNQETGKERKSSTLKTIELDVLVSDGPWLQQLRASMSKSFLTVNRYSQFDEAVS